MSGSALQRIAEEEAAARADIARAQRRLAALAALRREVLESAPGLEPEALFARLRYDLSIVEARARTLADAVRARDTACAERALADEEASEALQEIDRARAVELSAEAPSAAVLHAVRERAERARRRLASLVALANRPWDRVDAPPATIHALLAMAPAAGPVDAVVIVLPVPYGVQAEGAARGDDLCLRLACRLMNGVTRWLRELGMADAPVQVRDVRGCFALQVWLADAPGRARARESAVEAVADALRAGRELQAANLAVEVERVAASALAASPDRDAGAHGAAGAQRRRVDPPASAAPGAAAPSRIGALLRPLAIDTVALRLDLHPLDVARVASLRGPIGPDATFTAADVARLRADAGIEDGWLASLADASPPTVARALVARLLERRCVHPEATRADNLFRGLDAHVRPVVHSFVNASLRQGYLTSRMSSVGLLIAIAPDAAPVAQAFVSGGTGPLAELVGVLDVG